jgi:hypothetical protein
MQPFTASPVAMNAIPAGGHSGVFPMQPFTVEPLAQFSQCSRSQSPIDGDRRQALVGHSFPMQPFTEHVACSQQLNELCHNLGDTGPSRVFPMQPFTGRSEGDPGREGGVTAEFSQCSRSQDNFGGSQRSQQSFPNASDHSHRATVLDRRFPSSYSS